MCMYVCIYVCMFVSEPLCQRKSVEKKERQT